MYVPFCVFSFIVLFCVLYVSKCVLYCTVLYCTVLCCTVLYCTVLLPPRVNPIPVNKLININLQCTPLWYVFSRIRRSDPVPRDMTYVPSKDKVPNCLVAPCLTRRWARPLSIAAMFASRTYNSAHIHISRTYAQQLQVLRKSQHTHTVTVWTSVWSSYLDAKHYLSV